MKTASVIAVLAALLVAPSPCFALWRIAPVSKERAKEMGMEVRSQRAGPNQVRVELEFAAEGLLKDFSRVELRFGQGDNPPLTAPLQEDRSKPGRIVVGFRAGRAHLDKIDLRVFVPGSLGGTIYRIRPQDFVALKNDVVLGTVIASSGQQSRAQELDAKTLQGAWVLESLDGVRPETARGIRFEGDNVAGLFRDQEKNPLTLRFRLLADRKTRGIDVGPFPPAYNGLVIRGVYELQGDVLRLAFHPKLDARRIPPGYDIDEQRPESFDPKSVQVQVWRRHNDK